MQTHGGGTIVNMAANIGAHMTIPYLGAYTASKAAVSVLTRVAALEHIQAPGIRINAVSPGLVDTEMSLLPGGNPRTAGRAHQRRDSLGPRSRIPPKWPTLSSGSPRMRPVLWLATILSSTGRRACKFQGHDRTTPRHVVQINLGSCRIMAISHPVSRPRVVKLHFVAATRHLRRQKNARNAARPQ